MRNMEKTGLLAWCALIALLTAREDGLVESESQESLFITCWFAQVKKQRRFSRDVATDVDWVLNQGRTLGVRARLRHKLDYLWRSCTGELSEQNDLFRLTYALDVGFNDDGAQVMPVPARIGGRAECAAEKLWLGSGQQRRTLETGDHQCWATSKERVARRQPGNVSG